jgi:hypothetical protein
VAREVEQDLTEPTGVAARERGHVGRDEGDEVDALAAGLGAEQFGHAFDRIGRIEVDGFQLQLAGLEL